MREQDNKIKTYERHKMKRITGREQKSERKRRAKQETPKKTETEMTSNTERPTE